MKLPEKILLFLSRKPEKEDHRTVKADWDLSNALSLLNKSFPDFNEEIIDKTIVDFGCGMGYQSISMIQNGAKYVLGVDINKKALAKARESAKKPGVNEKVKFVEKIDAKYKDSFDIVISQNSMEHFSDPEKIILLIKSALKPGGVFFITFAPPWYAPYGSHMHFFTKVPWVNILFSEETVMSVRAKFRSDGAKKYEEVKSGLNKMTVAKFERLIASTGLKMKYKKYNCVKGLIFLSKIPCLRELFINQIICKAIK